jgi:Acetyltransferase (GNAT) domain
MNAALQLQYNDTMRRNSHVPGMVREATRHTVRYTNSHGSLRYVLWHDFSMEHTQEIVAEEIADARIHAGALCWRIHGDDSPRDALIACLIANGFTRDADATQHFIAPHTLVTNTLGAQVPPSIEIRELVSPLELEAYTSVWDEVWPNMPNARYVHDYQLLMESGERGLRFWAAFEGIMAVSTAYIIHPPGYPMALLCGGTTRKAYQRRGIYHALVAARARAAQAAGVETLCVDASSESAPLLQKIGFVPQGNVQFFEKSFD